MNIEKIKNKLYKKLSFFAINRTDISSSPYHVICGALTKRGRIISIGFNSYVKTHSLQKHYAVKNDLIHKEFLHAEISAIIKAKNKIHSVMILRKPNIDKLCNARPCPICRMALKEAGVKNVFFSNTKGEMEFMEL